MTAQLVVAVAIPVALFALFEVHRVRSIRSLAEDERRRDAVRQWEEAASWRAARGGPY